MDTKLEQSSTQLKKKLFKLILFIVYPAYILHSLVIAPIYTVLYSDVAVNPAIPVILYYLLVLVDLFVFFVSFAVMIYGLCRCTAGEIKGTLLLIFLSPLFKYVLKMLVSPFIDGIPTSDQLIMDVFSMGVSYLLEALQFLIVLLLSLSFTKAYREYRSAAIKAAARIGAQLPDAVHIVPFKKPLSFKNPLQRGAFISSAVIIAGRLFSLAMSDLNRNWIISGIGGYLSFFAPYVIEVVVGIIGYFFMLYVFISLYSENDGV